MIISNRTSQRHDHLIGHSEKNITSLMLLMDMYNLHVIMKMYQQTQIKRYSTK